MISEIIDIQQMSFGALFVWLLMDTNKKNAEREAKYQSIIDNLSVNIAVIEDVKEDVKEIKNIVIGGHKNE